MLDIYSTFVEIGRVEVDLEQIDRGRPARSNELNPRGGYYSPGLELNLVKGDDRENFFFPSQKKKGTRSERKGKKWGKGGEREIF